MPQPTGMSRRPRDFGKKQWLASNAKYVDTRTSNGSNSRQEAPKAISTCILGSLEQHGFVLAMGQLHPRDAAQSGQANNRRSGSRPRQTSQLSKPSLVVAPRALGAREPDRTLMVKRSAVTAEHLTACRNPGLCRCTPLGAWLLRPLRISRSL
jgi:hypothetical protein